MTALLELIKDAPVIIAFIEQIVAIIEKERDEIKRAALLKQIGNGLTAAHKTGDTSELESLFSKPSPTL